MARGKVKPDSECRLSWVNIRLTAAERAELEQKARAEGTTPTDLARRGVMIVLKGRPEQAPMAQA